MASSEMFIIVLLTTMKERLHKRFHMKSELPKHKRVKKQLAEGRGGGGGVGGHCVSEKNQAKKKKRPQKIAKTQLYAVKAKNLRQVHS